MTRSLIIANLRASGLTACPTVEHEISLIPPWIIIALVLTLLVVVATIAALKKNNAELLFERRDVLFSPAERSFLGVLDQAVGNQYRVFGKVRIADVLSSRKNASQRTRIVARNITVGKHFDFVICDASTLHLVCAVELDDRSHARTYRRARDAFVEHACRTSGLPLLRIAARKSYSLVDVRDAYFCCIEPQKPRVAGKAAEEIATPQSESGATQTITVDV